MSPVSVLVADDGDYFVTFDNWHSIGFGDNVIVIYRNDGSVVRSMCLNAFLPNSYLNALPRSTSSLNWSGEHAMGEELSLQVRVPSRSDQDSTFVTFIADLETGAVRPVDPEAWEAALQAARVRNEEIRIAGAWRSEPLLGPTETETFLWHRYLFEAFFRTADDWRNVYPSHKVILPPGDERHAASIGWFRDAVFSAGGRREVIMVASPSPTTLRAVLLDVAADVEPNAMLGVRLYIAVGDEVWSEIQAAWMPSGAILIQLDPTEPIAQRPERMPNEVGFDMSDWGDC